MPCRCDFSGVRDGTSFDPPRPGVGDRPFFFAEFQSGAFDPWGGPGYQRCRQMTGATFERMLYANRRPDYCIDGFAGSAITAWPAETRSPKDTAVRP